MADLKNRRPLSSRDTGWARAITRALADRGATPNGISIASIGAAALAGASFAGAGVTTGGAQAALLILGALWVQGRLLCNLFDGMVAVEAGKGSPTGPFWNEAPDRLADIAILVGFGMACGMAWLGWAAAALAVLIAYLRAFGGALGMEGDYSGPMAKQHRMAAVTAGAVLAALLSPWVTPALVVQITLWVVILGGCATALRRSATLLSHLDG